MKRKTAKLRRLLEAGRLVYMPSAYDALGGRLVEQAGFECAYVGGFVTGGSRATSEPLLTMDEQVRVAGDVAGSISIPLVADGGAGFGEPLHTMRSVREFIRAGVAGIHIEDQLYPKRAHYHKYVAHTVSREDFVDKIRFACKARDEIDRDFVVIARTDTCRFEGLDEAATRINMAADAGADMGLVFPRDDDEMKRAPEQCRIPLVYVISRGNRDGRPLPTGPQLAEMGYAAAIDAITSLLVSFHFNRKALEEVKKSGTYTGMTGEEVVAARQQIEDAIGLEGFYEIEEQTVEDKKWGKR